MPLNRTSSQSTIVGTQRNADLRYAAVVTGAAAAGTALWTVGSPWLASGRDRVARAVVGPETRLLQAGPAARGAARLARQEAAALAAETRGLRLHGAPRHAAILGGAAGGAMALRFAGEAGLEQLRVEDSAAKTIVGGAMLATGAAGIRRYAKPGAATLWRSTPHAISTVVAITGAACLLTGIADAVYDTTDRSSGALVGMGALLLGGSIAANVVSRRRWPKVPLPAGGRKVVDAMVPQRRDAGSFGVMVGSTGALAMLLGVGALSPLLNASRTVTGAATGTTPSVRQ